MRVFDPEAAAAAGVDVDAGLGKGNGRRASTDGELGVDVDGGRATLAAGEEADAGGVDDEAEEGIVYEADVGGALL